MNRMRPWVGVCTVALVLAAGTPGSAGGGVTFDSDKERNPLRADVTVRLVNRSNESLRITAPGKIVDKRTGKKMVTLGVGDRSVPPGAEEVWVWDRPGVAGRYRAVIETSRGKLRDTFDIGRYFTLGFDSNDASFVVWVNRGSDVEEMTAEVDRPQDERQIVSGIVRRKERYNRPWSYTMGPASIVLGDAFIEACDANPNYVEENVDSWRGERWCPWSSYVERVGR
ncbi:MAG: hypothetical protein ACRDKB_13695 [Actinomycetota bacterium]